VFLISTAQMRREEQAAAKWTRYVVADAAVRARHSLGDVRARCPSEPARGLATDDTAPRSPAKPTRPPARQDSKNGGGPRVDTTPAGGKSSAAGKDDDDHNDDDDKTADAADSRRACADADTHK